MATPSRHVVAAATIAVTGVVSAWCGRALACSCLFGPPSVTWPEAEATNVALDTALVFALSGGTELDLDSIALEASRDAEALDASAADAGAADAGAADASAADASAADASPATLGKTRWISTGLTCGTGYWVVDVAGSLSAHTRYSVSFQGTPLASFTTGSELHDAQAEQDAANALSVNAAARVSTPKQLTQFFVHGLGSEPMFLLVLARPGSLTAPGFLRLPPRSPSKAYSR